MATLHLARPHADFSVILSARQAAAPRPLNSTLECSPSSPPQKKLNKAALFAKLSCLKKWAVTVTTKLVLSLFLFVEGGGLAHLITRSSQKLSRWQKRNAFSQFPVESITTSHAIDICVCLHLVGSCLTNTSLQTRACVVGLSCPITIPLLEPIPCALWEMCLASLSGHS